MELVLTTREDLETMIDSAVKKAVSDTSTPYDPLSRFPELLDRGQAAKMLGVTMTTIDAWSNQGYITKHRIGDSRIVRFRKSEIITDLDRIGKMPKGAK